MTSILTNALITGGSGMIGTNIDFGNKPTSSEMNITNTNSIDTYINKLQEISCIIHLAATNLRESENDVKKAIDTNINGTTKMLKLAMKLNIPFIIISSGAVFSSSTPNVIFEEHHSACPNCSYGITKHASEEIAMLYEKTILIRTGWLFGGNQKCHYKFVEHVINHLVIHKEIKACNNFLGSPTYVMDLIEKMKYLIVNSKYGIHHVVNSGIASGYEIATEIANILNADHKLISSVPFDLVPNSGPFRSFTECLVSTSSYNHMRSCNESLREYTLLYYKNMTENISIAINSNNPTKQPSIWKNREKCRLCNSPNINVFFKLEPTPLANHFVSNLDKQETIPLDICICNDCKHVQLIQIVNPVNQYSNYFYVSSTSSTMVNHLKTSIIQFTQELNLSKTDYILEIGANDGVCIEHLLSNGFQNSIGIDPASNINNRHNLPIVCDFFGSNIQTQFQTNYKPFKLIYSFHCCAHIENIDDVFDTIYNLLEKDGTFIMEVGYFYDVFEKRLFDTIYHEHIDYHTCNAIQRFSLTKNLKLYKVKQTSIQGGSIQFFFSKTMTKSIENSVNECIEKEKKMGLHKYETLNKWQTKILQCGKDINCILNSFVSNGKKIAGYGASAKSTTFLHQYKLSNKLINYIVDDNIYKQDFFSPGLHIPIKSIYNLEVEKVDYIIILSWNFKNEIIQKLQPYMDTGVRIIIPFPEIQII